MLNKYKIIEKNKKIFEWFFNKVEKITDLRKQVEFGQKAANILTYKNVGYYYSTKLEKIFTDIAKSHDLDNYNIEYKKGTFLHVMTMCCKVGGHTRVVERWIGQSPSEQEHSVVLLQQDDVAIPGLLQENIKEKNGELIVFEKGMDFIKKALKLRELALHYEYIVLHVHMDDPTALIAFGTEKFTRPVIFFNHADHLFWLGKSISDIVADIKGQISITQARRGIDKNFVLGVPVENKTVKKIDKNRARKKLAIPVDKKIILSVGSEFKFTPLNNKSIVDILHKKLLSNENVLLYLIGPSVENKYWKNVQKKYGEKIKILGEVDYENEYFEYINSADLILDSWPVGGGAVMQDAINCDKPVLSLETPLGQLDYLSKSNCYCKTEQEFLDKIQKVLDDKEFADEIINEVKNNLAEESSPEIFREKLKKLFEATPKSHSVKDLSQEVEPQIIDEKTLILNLMYNKNFFKNFYYKKFLYNIEYYLYRYILRNEKKAYKYLEKFIECF